MTLEKTWEECLRMWKWIADVRLGEIDDGLRGLDVVDLKHIWITANNYVDVFSDCFFCDYAVKHGSEAMPGDCKECPGQYVRKGFNCHKNPVYRNNPVEFCILLIKLNNERLSEKGKK